MKTVKLLLTLLVFCPFIIKAQTYCVPPNFYSGPLTGITNVTIGTLNNTSLYNDGYTYYSSATKPSLDKSTPYNISITITDIANFTPINIRVWIDLNNDKDFDDTGEEVAAWNSVIMGGGTINTNITIPASATSGTTRMRVFNDMDASGGHDDPPVPCGYLYSANSIGQHGECEDYDIVISSGVIAPVADFTANDTTICEGVSVNFSDISTNSPTSWSWTFAGGTPASSIAQNPTITYNSAGVYAVSLTATNSGGSDIKTVNNGIAVYSLPTADAGLDTVICEGGTATLVATGGLSYLWSNYTINDTNIVTPLSNTTYTVTVEDINSCQDVDIVTVTVNPLPAVDLVGDTIVCVNHTVILYAAPAQPGTYTYIWSNASTLDSLVVDSTGVGAGSATYYVTVTDLSGCKAVDSVTVTFDPCTGIQETDDKLIIEIFPNPSKGIFTIDITGLNNEFELKVLNVDGQVIYNEKLDNTKSHYIKEIDLSTHAKGVYFIKLMNNKMFVEKIVIQ